LLILQEEDATLLRAPDYEYLKIWRCRRFEAGFKFFGLYFSTVGGIHREKNNREGSGFGAKLFLSR
jgi:hypothetical protein